MKIFSPPLKVSLISSLGAELKTISRYYIALSWALSKKWSFLLNISSVNVTISTGNCRFGLITKEILMESFIFVQLKFGTIIIKENGIFTWNKQTLVKLLEHNSNKCLCKNQFAFVLYFCFNFQKFSAPAPTF